MVLTGTAIDTSLGLFKRIWLRCELVNLKKLNSTSVSPEAFQNSKYMVKFYTGLPKLDCSNNSYITCYTEQ